MYAHWFTYGRLLCEFCCVSDDSAVRWTLVLVSCAITYLRIAHYPASGYVQLSRCIHLWVVRLSLWTFSTHGANWSWMASMNATDNKEWLAVSFLGYMYHYNKLFNITHTPLPSSPYSLEQDSLLCNSTSGLQVYILYSGSRQWTSTMLGNGIACTSIANCTAWSGDLRKRTTTWHPNLWPTL